MIIYRDTKNVQPVNKILDRLDRLLLMVRTSSDRHDLITELMITFGEFEAAFADYTCSEADTQSPETDLFRQAAVNLGEVFIHSEENNTDKITGKLKNFEDDLRLIKNLPMPGSLTLRVPEGFAFYGLYPEMYLYAADWFISDIRPGGVVVIAIRSIGTTLSSVVSARLRLKGPLQASMTLRPRGDFFDREIRASESLKDSLYSKKGCYFLIIDEGPGLSGSSLSSVAFMLTEMGIEDDKIIYLPAWIPDSRSFISTKAREHWLRHRKYSTDFEEVFIRSGRLQSAFGADSLLDISAGKWRSLFYSRHEDYPSVYPNFEQRKYLGLPGGRGISAYLKGAAQEIKFLKFAGLGHYGRSLHKRGEILSEASYFPEVTGFKMGFLSCRFIKGKPLDKNGITARFLEHAAGYIAFIKNSFPTEVFTPPEEIARVVSYNSRILFGDDITAGVSEKFLSWGRTCPGVAAEVDGRMLPFEWLETDKGFIKTDSLHHHSGHFFPGAADIAWDVAGLIQEFGLEEPARSYFIQSYISRSGDDSITERLRFYEPAYLIFRASMAGFISERLSAQEQTRSRLLCSYYKNRILRIIQS